MNRDVRCVKVSSEGRVLTVANNESKSTNCDPAERPVEVAECNYGECSARLKWQVEKWSTVFKHFTSWHSSCYCRLRKRVQMFSSVPKRVAMATRRDKCIVWKQIRLDLTDTSSLQDVTSTSCRSDINSATKIVGWLVFVFVIT